MDAGCDIDAGLNRLFEAGLELALAIQADAMAAESPEARAKLAVAFHRVSRGVRQTAALKMKLLRDAERAQREGTAAAEARRDARIGQRKAHLAKRIERLIETEVDEDEQFDATEDLAVRLDTEVLDPAFLDEPVDQQIARICQALHLPSPLAGEGVGRSPTDEGWRPALHREPPSAIGDAGETPHPTPSGGHLLPQGEKDEIEFDAAPPPEPRGSG